MVNYNLIVSMCRNNGIGKNGQLPWHIKNDLHYFSKLTKGDGHNAVIMGQNTWKSLPPVKGCLRGLTGRDNFILTSTSANSATSTTSANSHNTNNRIKTFATVADMETFISENEFYEDLWVIGGAQIYQHFLAMDKINKCYITSIDKDFDCDVFFPALDLNVWREIERTDSYEESYACEVSYRIYEKFKGQNTDCH